MSSAAESFSGAPQDQQINPDLFRQGDPWRLVADLNELCNIQCGYCHIDALWGPAAKNARTLPPDVAGRVLEDGDRMQVFDATLTGGEITTMRNFPEYLDKISALTFTSVQIITNGTRLTPALASELKGAGVKRVSISIDGPESSNDAARGDGTWRRAWRGMENAVAAGLGVNVISVLGRHNIDDWDALSPMLKDAGVRSQNLSLMCRLGRAEQAEEWPGVPPERVREVQQKAARLKETLSDSSFALFLNDGVLQTPGWSGEPTPLHAFQDRNPGIEAVVKVDGSVLRNRLYGKGRSIGNVNEQSFAQLWRADQAQRAQLEGVVGEGNVGTLPSLYHHYEAGTGQQQAVPTTTPEAVPASDNKDLRVREEPWGTITFDPATFSITSIVARSAARA
ncbi:MAG TPA: radical SAM protein [Candidatus Saccharimonadales bacterium]|nr:radical SAM protein [Candidatus Saccharimonadales bacterium]